MKSISGLIESAKTVYDFKDAIWEDAGVDCDRCDYEMQVLYVQNRLYLVTCPCDVVHVMQARSPKDAIRKVNLGMTSKTSKTRPVETEQPVIYIAGPMTGHEDFNRPAFFEAESYLRSQGYEEIYNPAIAQHTLPYKTLIDLGLKTLKGCNTIYMLHGWYQSRGARLEHLYALTVGLEIVYQEEIKGEKDG